MFSFSKLLGRKSEISTGKTVGLALLDAIYAFENESYEDAAAMFEGICDAIPTHPLAHLMLGRTLIRLEDYEGAIESLLRHLEIVPNSVEGLIYLGLAYFEIEEVDAAVERFHLATRLKKDSLLARENLAVARLAAGDLEQALNDLTALHEDEPHESHVIELIVLTLGKLGRWDAAKRYSSELHKVGSHHEADESEK